MALYCGGFHIPFQKGFWKPFSCKAKYDFDNILLFFPYLQLYWRIINSLGIDDYYMIQRMDHEEYRIIGFVLLTILMILFPLTQLVVGRILGFNAPLEFDRYLHEPVRTSVDKNRRILASHLEHSLLFLFWQLRLQY